MNYFAAPAFNRSPRAHGPGGVGLDIALGCVAAVAVLFLFVAYDDRCGEPYIVTETCYKEVVETVCKQVPVVTWVKVCG